MFTPRKTVGQIVAAAKARIENLSLEGLQAELETGEAQVLDIRDIRERKKFRWVPASQHAPRGMLEFWFNGWAAAGLPVERK